LADSSCAAANPAAPAPMMIVSATPSRSLRPRARLVLSLTVAVAARATATHRSFLVFVRSLLAPGGPRLLRLRRSPVPFRSPGPRPVFSPIALTAGHGKTSCSPVSFSVNKRVHDNVCHALTDRRTLTACDAETHDLDARAGVGARRNCAFSSPFRGRPRTASFHPQHSGGHSRR